MVMIFASRYTKSILHLFTSATVTSKAYTVLCVFIINIIILLHCVLGLGTKLRGYHFHSPSRSIILVTISESTAAAGRLSR